MKVKFRILRMLVAVSLLVFLFVKIDMIESLSLFYRLDLFAIIAILLVTFWLIFVSVLKWQMFLKSLQLASPFWRLYGLYLVGYFFNNFLPSNVGGDIVRFTLAARGKETYTSSFVAVFMERFTGILATLLFVCVAIPPVLTKFSLLESKALVLMPTIGIFIFLSALILVQPEYLDRFMSGNVLIRKACSKIREILVLIHSFKGRKKLLFKAMVFSIIFNFIAIINVYVVSNALGLHIGFFHLFILVPLILLVSSIPLSINAIGIAEGAYVVCLSLVGLNAAEALSIALLMRAKTLAVSLLGGLVFIGFKKQQGVNGIGKAKPYANDPIS